jgi:hypothetical protein
MPDGPGAREPNPQAVSALRASPPIASRDDLAMRMLAAWMNVRVDQIPPENTSHLNAVTMAAWQRVGEVAAAFLAPSAEAVARAIMEDAKRQNPAGFWMDWLTDDEETDDGEERHRWRFHTQHAPLDALQLAHAVLAQGMSARESRDPQGLGPQAASPVPVGDAP